MTYVLDFLNTDAWGFALALLLVLIATARLSRFITSDTLGEWLIVAPLKRWAARDIIAPAAAPQSTRTGIDNLKMQALDWGDADALDQLIEYGASDPNAAYRARLVTGLDCPFCVGFWIGAVVLIVTVLIMASGIVWLTLPWLLGLSTLALNYIVAHISSRLD